MRTADHIVNRIRTAAGAHAARSVVPNEKDAQAETWGNIDRLRLEMFHVVLEALIMPPEERRRLTSMISHGLVPRPLRPEMEANKNDY